MTPRSHARTRAIALTVATLLALSALSSCGDDPTKPKPLDPPETSTSSSPTATEPPKPLTAEQIIREFIKAQDAMYANGESKEFLALSHKCKYCDGQAELIGGIYRKGGYVLGAENTIRSIRLQQGMSSQVFKVFNVVYDISAATFRRRKNAKVERDPAETNVTSRYRLVKRPGGWKIHEVTLLQDRA